MCEMTRQNIAFCFAWLFIYKENKWEKMQFNTGKNSKICYNNTKKEASV